MGAIGSIVQGIFDIVAQERQMRHDKNIQERSYTFNEMAADNADTRTRNLYQDFETPSAKKRMLEDAGFNPALVYGGMNGSIPHGAQGAGGSASANNLGGITAPSAMEIYDILNAKKDLEIKESQKENIDADTRNKDADTLNKGKEYYKIDEEINLLKSQGKLTDEQAEKVKGEIGKISIEIDKITSEINKNIAETEKTEFEKNVLLPSTVALNKWNSGDKNIEVFGDTYNKGELDFMIQNVYMKVVKGLSAILGISMDDARKKAKEVVDKLFEMIGGEIYEKYQKWKEWSPIPKEGKEWIERNKNGKDPFSWQDK